MECWGGYMWSDVGHWSNGDVDSIFAFAGCCTHDLSDKFCVMKGEGW